MVVQQHMWWCLIAIMVVCWNPTSSVFSSDMLIGGEERVPLIR